MAPACEQAIAFFLSLKELPQPLRIPPTLEKRTNLTLKFAQILRRTEKLETLDQRHKLHKKVMGLFSRAAKAGKAQNQKATPEQSERENQQMLSSLTGSEGGEPLSGATNVLYQVSWEGQSQQQPILQQGYRLSPASASLPQHYQQQPLTVNSAKIQTRGSSASIPLNPPMQELSVAELSPFPAQIWSFTLLLSCGLMMWISYLILPRGCRKQYCSAYRKRYPRTVDGDMPAAGYYLPANRSIVTAASADGSKPMRRAMTNGSTGSGGAAGMVRHTPIHSRNPPILQTTSSISSMGVISEMDSENPLPATPVRQAYGKYGGSGGAVQNPPSPDHPALPRIPSDKILTETMHRLENRGIRLVAHGVHCDPKRVWVQLDLNEENDGVGGGSPSVTWQTEFPRRVPNQSGQVSIVLMRGSLHRIALTNVLYIDVGKKTNALLKLDPSKIPDSTCFSLLTQNGSLDLQANSKLERDALVSCFSIILDKIHGNLDWRALYEASPDPSLANSSSIGGFGTPLGLPRSNWRGSTPASANFITPNHPIHAGTRRTQSSELTRTGGSGGTGMEGRRTPNYSSQNKNYPNPSDMLVEV